MSRSWSTNARGEPFDEKTVLAVWLKATQEPPFATFRLDAFGSPIQSGRYGTQDKWGWEIDHIKPVASGGTDDLSNLQALQWENNRRKGDHWPDWADEGKG